MTEQYRKKEIEEQKDLIDMIPAGIGIFEVKNGEVSLKYLNDGYFHMLGINREEEKEISYSQGKQNMHPDDEEKLINLLGNANQEEGYQTLLRMKDGSGRYRWLKVSSKLLDRTQEGYTVYVCFTDVDELEEMRGKLQESRSSMEAAIEAAGSCYFEYYPEKRMALEYNLREAFGVEEVMENYPDSWFAQNITHPEDVQILREAFRQIDEGARRIECDVRNRIGASYFYYHYVFTSIYDMAGKRTKVVAFAQDITALKERELELRESNAMYKLTTEYANINLWQYDIVNDVLYNTENSEQIHQGGSVLYNFSKAVVEQGIVRGDSVADFRRMFQEMKSGKKVVSADIWFKNKQNDGWWCERITYITLTDENGKPYRAIGMGENITELKDAQRRLEEEKRYQDALEGENLITTARCNLTQNRVERYESGNPVEGISVGISYDKALEYLVENCTNIQARERIRECLNREYIQKELEKGRDTFTFEYRKEMANGHIRWVSKQVRAFVDPVTHDVMVFLYVYDIEHQRTLETIVNHIAEVEYELLALLELKSNRVRIAQRTVENDPLPADYDNFYDVEVNRFIDQYFTEDTRRKGKEDFQIQHIMEQLDKNGSYTVSYPVVSAEGICRKKWEFSYLDEAHETIIFTRADVTKLFEQQEQQKEDLRNALVQAEQASLAKSSFLSRMSHEIRTPMNAIIGMTALAAQNVNNPEQVKDYLSKVGISARFLLSLINDILDMSRIESGKVTIRKDKFPFEELIGSVNTIIYEQASQKGVDYDCVLESFTAPYYMGDSMKLQQILVNLLGNAVKFTESGGKVQLIVNQERVENGKAYMRFSVNDTGIGISEELQAKMFDPFEQGNATITTPYKGTGLGLAICKNLITMMNGTIEVNSIEGIGTEFTVKLALDVCEDESIYSRIKVPLSLEKMNLLVVDDDIAVCEHTKAILIEMGMNAEWVESGRKAVELVGRKWEKHQKYDVILVDWKMPDMDGIETARQIRKIVGPEVTIIVMTAYDWREIEYDAKLAGVNLLVAKPLFKTSIMSIFERIFTEKEEKKQREEPKEYHFEGRNILLVEDHILNVEVARKLLEAKGAAVEVAQNGLQAIEAFAQHQDGDFDAVLMDIRMPVMDGLTAARSIRQLRMESAKTVPIIAMSANAFDEDVEKSKLAGMNEHLSKPIEPAMLYAVLEKWFNQ